MRSRIKNRKYITPFLVIFTVILLGVSFQSFIIDAKAQIDPIVVQIGALGFGIVFPSEELEKTFTVGLAEGSECDPRYQISHSIKPLVESDKDYCLSNPQDYTRCYPDLCAFLNEQSIDVPTENDTAANAYLFQNDTSDTWLVNLIVPPIEGFIGQDFEGLTVGKAGVYGCDIEVRVLECPERGGPGGPILTFGGGGYSHLPEEPGEVAGETVEEFKKVAGETIRIPDVRLSASFDSLLNTILGRFGQAAFLTVILYSIFLAFIRARKLYPRWKKK